MAYSSDVINEDRAVAAPYLTLVREHAPQRDYSPRDLFSGEERMTLGNSPGCCARALTLANHVRTRRWIAAECSEALAGDLRALRATAAGE